MQQAVGLWSGPHAWPWAGRAGGGYQLHPCAMAWLAWWPNWRLPRFRRTTPKPMSEPAWAERREAFRYGISLETSVRLMAAVEGDPLPVRVRNISVGGISLVVHRS